MTTLELVNYYAKLLILQYIGKPKAYESIKTWVTPIVMPQVSIQEVIFPIAPTSGTFVLSYLGNDSVSINWNDSAATIQTDLRAIDGLSLATVTGSISSLSLVITLTGVVPPAESIVLGDNSLMNSGTLVVPVIEETDVTLPLAVQGAYNIIGNDPALGVQLDVLGKYAGVTRTGRGIRGEPVTLGDADFLTLIKFAVLQNNSGSSLAEIEVNLNQFFPGQFIVTDYRNMYLSYIFGSSLGSVNLFALLIEQNLIPKPMGVGLNVILPPNIDDFFGFSTYDSLNNNAKPFNTYDSYDTSWLWLSYDDAFVP